MASTMHPPGRQSSDDAFGSLLKVPLGFSDYADEYNQGNGPVAGEPPPNGGNGDVGTDLVITDVTPNTGPANTVTAVHVTGFNLTQTKGNPTIGKSCHNTVVNDDFSLDTDTPGNQGAGIFPVLITLQDGVTQVTGPNFTYF